jgi:hypothetical protein
MLGLSIPSIPSCALTFSPIKDLTAPPLYDSPIRATLIVLCSSQCTPSDDFSLLCVRIEVICLNSLARPSLLHHMHCRPTSSDRHGFRSHATTHVRADRQHLRRHPCSGLRCWCHDWAA